MRIGLFALASLALFVACKPTLSKQEKEELAKLQATAKEQAKTFDQQRRDAITAAQGKIEPRKDLGACPVEISTSLLEPSSAYGSRHAENESGVQISLEVLGIWAGSPDELATKPGSMLKKFDLETSYLGDEPSALKRMHEAADTPWKPELVVLIDKKISPKITDDKTFEGGIALGRAYVYSFTDKAIVCAARFLAENSETVTVTMIDATHVAPGSIASLEGDLLTQSVLAAKKALFKAGPPDPKAALDDDDDAPAPSSSAKAGKGKAPPAATALPALPAPKKRKILE